MVWSEDTPEEMIAVLESTSRLERLTDEIVSFVDRDDEVTAEQIDDLTTDSSASSARGHAVSGPESRRSSTR